MQGQDKPVGFCIGFFLHYRLNATFPICHKLGKSLCTCWICCEQDLLQSQLALFCCHRFKYLLFRKWVIFYHSTMLQCSNWVLLIFSKACSQELVHASSLLQQEAYIAPERYWKYFSKKAKIVVMATLEISATQGQTHHDYWILNSVPIKQIFQLPSTWTLQNIHWYVCPAIQEIIRAMGIHIQHDTNDPPT